MIAKKLELKMFKFGQMVYIYFGLLFIDFHKNKHKICTFKCNFIKVKFCLKYV